MIQVKTYTAPEYNFSEIFRYASADTESLPMLKECISEAESVLTYKVCYEEFDVKIDGDLVITSAFSTTSSALAKNLSGCRKILIFGATIGVGFDRLIAKYGSISPSKAILFQGLGAERIEALCDAFCKDMEKEYGGLFPRFSPGYGDFDISCQKEIFQSLDLAKKIGLTLNESLLMSPSKSVTAIIGIGSNCKKTDSACRACKKIDCSFRKKEI